MSEIQTDILDLPPATWNLARVASLDGVRGCRNGLALYIGSSDHGNAHIEVKQGVTRLAKIFMRPDVILDPATPCRLERVCG